MASKPPQRIPPPRLSTPITPAEQTPPAPSIDWASSSVASDAYALQAQLEQLSQQFDQMKSQLRHAQKLASIGTTAATIAHEFNNLLTPVVAYGKQALETEDPGMMRTALIKTMERTALLREMADRVVGLARQPDGVIRKVKLLPIVQNAIGCLGRDLSRDGIDVNVQIDSELAVKANENQLLQVLFNLVLNARHAMLNRRGRLSIDAAALHEGSVTINVRDTGCGITPENLSRVFEPFFSTKQNAEKPDARGLGLGLYICQDIIAELDGHISVASQVGAGTTFTITLPIAE